MSKIFTQLPEELFDHPLWIEASNDYRSVLTVILRRSAYTDQIKIGLKKGQCRISFSQLHLEANVPLSTAKNAVNHFKGINTKRKTRGDVAAGLVPLLVSQEVSRKVSQEKSLYNIMLAGYYENGEPVSEPVSKPEGEPKVSQRRASSPRENEYTIKEAEKLYILDQHQTSLESEKEDWSVLVVGLLNAGIEEKFHESLKSKGMGKVHKALDHITSSAFTIKQSPIQAIRWAIREKVWEWDKPKDMMTNREKVLQHFVDGYLYNDATCGINKDEIWFYRGNMSLGAVFEKQNFWAEFQKTLTKFGIYNPFEKKNKIGKENVS